jgi:hypothetical protein
LKNHYLLQILKMGLLPAFCLLSWPTAAQSIRYPQGAPYTGLGAYSYQFVDAFSTMDNQAALARLPAAEGGVYAEKRFLQEKLNSYSAVVALPTGMGGWGVSAHYFGTSEYNESQVGIAYGKKLGRVDLGVQINYAMMQAAGYGSDGTVIVEVGTIWHITEKAHAGIHIYNPSGGKYGKQATEKMAWQYKAGGGYEVSENVLVSADIIKQEDKAVNLQVGMQYSLHNRFMLRAGIATAATAPWLGAGWTWKNVRVDITGRYHPQLGITPGLLLLFSAKQTKLSH